MKMCLFRNKIVRIRNLEVDYKKKTVINNFWIIYGLRHNELL